MRLTAIPSPVATTRKNKRLPTRHRQAAVTNSKMGVPVLCECALIFGELQIWVTRVTRYSAKYDTKLVTHKIIRIAGDCSYKKLEIAFSEIHYIALPHTTPHVATTHLITLSALARRGKKNSCFRNGVPDEKNSERTKTALQLARATTASIETLASFSSYLQSTSRR